MEKKQRNIIIAIGIVAIVIIAVAGVALTYQPTPAPEKVIYWYQVAPVNQEALLRTGSVEGAVGWEPYSSAAILDDVATPLLWSADLWPNHPCCVIAVKYNAQFPDNATNEDLVARIVRANMDASQWLIHTVETHDQNYSALLQMGSKFSSTPSLTVTTAMVADALNHTGYSNAITPETKNWFVNYTNMFADLNQLTNLAGYSNATNYVNGMTNTSYLAKALLVQPSDSILNPKNTVYLGYLNGDLHQFARVIAMNKTLWGGQTLFEKYGVLIDSPSAFANGPAVMSALGANLIEVGYLGAPPALLLRANSNIPIQIISLVNTEGSAIIAKTGITSFDELNGKTVVTPGPGSIQHLMLAWYCEQQGYVLKLKGT